MNKSDTIGKLAEALAKAQAEFKAPPKDKKNPHFGNKYADLATIIEAVKGPLAKYGLSVTQLPVAGDGASVTLETALLHSSGEWISSAITMKAEKPTAQGYGSALTYARRYALGAILSVAAEEDDDGNSASAPASKPADKPPAQKQAPQHDANSAGLCEEYKQAIAQARDEETIRKIGAAILGDHKAHAINDTQKTALKKLADARRQELGIVAGNGVAA